MNSPYRYIVLFVLSFTCLWLKGEEKGASGLVPSYSLLLDSAVIANEKGDYENAAFYYERALQAYKEHYRSRMANMHKELEASYETETKTQEYERLEQALELKKTEVFLFSLFIVILAVAVIVMFVTQKYRLQSIEQKRMRKEKETVMLRMEKEKKELEMQLNTLQARKYQKELLAGAFLVEYKNKVLEELRLFFHSHPSLRKFKDALEVILTEETPDNLSDGTNKPDTPFGEIHPSFYARLQKVGGNKLTPLDLKYCRMIYLKMSSKEMADLLQVDPKTIRVTKYRLKQKLGLGKEKDLGEFIESMV